VVPPAAAAERLSSHQVLTARQTKKPMMTAKTSRCQFASTNACTPVPVLEKSARGFIVAEPLGAPWNARSGGPPRSGASGRPFASGIVRSCEWPW
jgi:hypothetical protein